MMKFTPARTTVDVLEIRKSYRDNLCENELHDPS